jgi:hypothetical protein
MDESGVIPYPGIRDWQKPVLHNYLILNYGQAEIGFTGKILMKIYRLKAFQLMWLSIPEQSEPALDFDLMVNFEVCKPQIWLIELSL